MESKINVLSTEQEKRWNDFENFLNFAQPRQLAKLNFRGDVFKVRVNYRRQETYGDVRPGNQIVSLEVVPRKRGIPHTIIQQICNIDDTELIRTY